MRQITKDIRIKVDGSRTGFRLTKLDAFSGITLLRLGERAEQGGRFLPFHVCGTREPSLPFPGHVEKSRSPLSF